MAQYFENDPALKREFKRLQFYLNGREFTFETCTGVYSKDKLDEYSLMLVNGTVSYEVCGRVLDLGCGYGAIGILLKSRFPEIELVMLDVNETAVELARTNCELNGVRAEVVCSDCEIPGAFDLVVLNPPIHAGKSVVLRMFREVREHLNDSGSFVLVVQKKHGAESLIRELQSIFRVVVTLYRKNGVYIVRCGN